MLNDVLFLSMQVELPDGGVGRYLHAAAAVRNDSTVHITEFGGVNSLGTTCTLAATTVLQISKYLGGGDKFFVLLSTHLELFILVACHLLLHTTELR